MALKPGTMLGPYEIVAQIGAGGMGEVYKGLDTRLNRDVAIKVLPEHLALNAELRERFQREAETIANLHHPNICVLYDIGEQDGVQYLVMEYLEGETLAQRLLKGPLPLEQTLRYAIEISDALDKAHRKGATHRDIKPGNIMLTKIGGAIGTKLLDFGLAKLKQQAVVKQVKLASDAPTPPAHGTPGQAASPPVGSPTLGGTILGTVQYMSPEQVEGRVDDIDGRSDIFSFGATVYEMLTGKKAFEGKSTASVMSKIMQVDPPAISSLDPPGKAVPPALDRVIKKCLAKEQEDRWQSARDLHDELDWIKSVGGQAGMPALTEAKPTVAGWWRALGWALASLVILLVARFGLRPFGLGSSEGSLPDGAPPMRLSVVLPPGDQLTSLDRPFAFSPDGSQLAFAASRSGSTQLYVRDIGSLQVKSIPGTEGAQGPFYSPDGQWIGFNAQGKLKKVSVAGASLQTLCDASGSYGGSWGARDTIYFSLTGTSGIWAFPASGGEPKEINRPDRSKGEVSIRWPELTPDGNALIFTTRTGGGNGEARIEVQNLTTGERRVLVEGGQQGRFVAPGYLVYQSAGSLLALPFDLSRLELIGNVPVTIASELFMNQTSGIGQFASAGNGALAYIPGSPHQLDRRLVWVDRKGNVEPLPAPARPFGDDAVRLSPDGKRVAVRVLSDSLDAWMYDLERGTLTRLTSEAGGSERAIWTPDGKRLIYRAARTGVRNLFWRAADGTGTEEQLTSMEGTGFPDSVTPEGKSLVYSSAGDLWLLDLEGNRNPRMFLHTPFNEDDSILSPDGRWLAYASTMSGASEVYIQPFPGPGERYQISTDGGDVPVWNPRGGELFYRNGNRTMAADINISGSTLLASKPRVLFEGDFSDPEVSRDGQRFLFTQPVEPTGAQTQITVVLNWTAGLKK